MRLILFISSILFVGYVEYSIFSQVANGEKVSDSL